MYDKHFVFLYIYTIKKQFDHTLIDILIVDSVVASTALLFVSAAFSTI